MSKDIESFFEKGCGRCDRFETSDCSTQRWAEGLAALRQICLSVGLTETVKWSHPCYMHENRNIAVLGAFREDFRLSFMNPSLLTDPDKVLEKAGENSQHANTLRFSSVEALRELADTIKRYLNEAMGYAEAGVKPQKSIIPLELPAELTRALESDTRLASAFEKLTPGRKRSYIINLNGAKKAETRMARIEKFRQRIYDGKGALERY